MLRREGWRDNHKKGLRALSRAGFVLATQAAQAKQVSKTATTEADSHRGQRDLEYGFFYGPPANRKRGLVAVDDSRLSIRPVVIRLLADLACMM
ncbi:exported hypothetical protein [Paraburkholderia piptadeniae]|uniref:Uncharacterized protein n=1 Tax=Paraburkholderia piptadeniae TaxID=1701573 RepID=A0A1N7SMY5_9BURK|nr:exported hypothetical protein [Paraburkholderia piptadeniae]